MKSNRVIQIQLQVSTTVWQQMTEARGEAARLWNKMVKLHLYCRKRNKKWPTQAQFEKHFARKFRLHSQTIQALIGKFFANIETTRTNRANGDKRARYPYKEKTYFNPVWKGQHIKQELNYIMLPMGIDPHTRKRQLAISVRLPETIPQGKIVQAELAFGKLLLTIQNGIEVEKPKVEKVAASDLGSIHLGVVTDGTDSLAVVGRGLRSINQGKAKASAQISQLQSRCEKYSRRWKKLQATKRKILRKTQNQTHNLLHKAANEIVDYCQEKEVSKLVVGDITEINKNKRKKASRRLNQEMGLLSLGVFVGYLKYKFAAFGIELETTSESYTTKTCPACGHKHKPKGRQYHCPKCGFVGVRDEVGAINLLNKYLNKGTIKPQFLIPNGNVKYLRPVKLKNFAKRSSPTDTGQPSIHVLCAVG
ncbi:MAG: IS200/IS605 family element transposase accessory protein TnpB [Acidobacteria bacterium]|nr:IS200/IS605 family element transposase accessory protein TnpB [Acidobacteriota bacterium]